MKLLYAGVLALMPLRVLAQTPGATPAGHEVNVSASSYTYVEPRPLRISIHAAKIGGEYMNPMRRQSSKESFVSTPLARRRRPLLDS
jgi:hypothetical protein